MKTAKTTPVKRSIDSLINNTAKELNEAMQDFDTNRTNQSLQRMRELQEVMQQALELAESYKNITSKRTK